MNKTVSIREARRNLERLIEEVRDRGQRVTIERSGEPMAVVIGIAEWENIRETLAELDDPEYLASIEEARREIARGETLTLEELRAEAAEHRHVG
ncbi:MAG: type II toxin-antitoxin system Phd/YefM family antitoxin [Chloroflexi bacterium]|nr:type II toxin-antitoxin system Phd/YefM family antitoxin [Chloroflexota bacterium]